MCGICLQHSQECQRKSVILETILLFGIIIPNLLGPEREYLLAQPFLQGGEDLLQPDLICSGKVSTSGDSASAPMLRREKMVSVALLRALGHITAAALCFKRRRKSTTSTPARGYLHFVKSFKCTA